MHMHNKEASKSQTMSQCSYGPEVQAFGILFAKNALAIQCLFNVCAACSSAICWQRYSDASTAEAADLEHAALSCFLSAAQIADLVLDCLCS